MDTQTRLSRHNKFISAENITAILSVSSDDSLHAFLLEATNDTIYSLNLNFVVCLQGNK